MNASKETARKANQDLEEAAIKIDLLSKFALDDNDKETVTNLVTSGKKALIRVQNFLDAAEAKLPTEAAYAKDKGRRKPKKAG